MRKVRPIGAEGAGKFGRGLALSLVAPRPHVRAVLVVRRAAGECALVGAES